MCLPISIVDGSYPIQFLQALGGRHGVGPVSYSPQLTILAPTAVVAADRFHLGILFRLAGDTQAHAGDGLAAGIGNGFVTFLAVSQAFARWQPVTYALDRILDGCIDLVLNCPVFCESAGH